MRDRARLLAARPLGAGLRLALASPPVERLVERALVRLRHRYPDARALAVLAGECLRAVERRGAGDFVRVAALPGGALLAIDVRDDWQRGLYYRGAYEPETTRLVRGLARPGDVVLDVGANAGYYSCLAAARGAEVHAFEPSTETLSGLRTNVGDRVRVVPKGAWSSDETLELKDYGSEHSAVNTFVGSRDEALDEPDTTYRVPVLAIDGYVSSAGTAPTFIKVDAEGAELEVLRGARRTLAEEKPIVTIEVGDTEDDLHSRKTIEFAGTLGYAPFDLTVEGIRPHEVRDRYDYGNLVLLPEGA